ncbi:hypothetical protein [Halomonas ramblicola]|uniref:hypothetical protein n=1 Tax=Halomonas ramblicola TaxID=747349 RepID=UPI0025B3B41F|nr:hypothetical protein [Halomonas ramblicola]MDN3522302.1 hypothetical protein [Halomonas ramblicola]
MTLRLSPFARSLSLGAVALGPVSTVLAHPGHGAPGVHAHTGSPSMLAVLAIGILGVAAIAAMARLVLRRRRLARRR